MTCSVNLVPVAQVTARSRARRRTAWLTVCALAGLMLAGGWIMQFASAAALRQLQETIAATEVQRSEIQRRVVAANGRRAQLLDQLQTLAQGRRPQPWPQRLVALTRDAPEGVFLTALEVSTQEQTSPAPPRDSGATAASAVPAPGPAREGAAAPKTPTERCSVHLRGYAIDHGALIQFLNALQSAGQWQSVELVRANQEPFRRGTAVAFEFECRAAEATP